MTGTGGRQTLSIKGRGAVAMRLTAASTCIAGGFQIGQGAHKGPPLEWCVYGRLRFGSREFSKSPRRPRKNGAKCEI
jgi:hypothetical protein